MKFPEFFLGKYKPVFIKIKILIPFFSFHHYSKKFTI